MSYSETEAMSDSKTARANPVEENPQVNGHPSDHPAITSSRSLPPGFGSVAEFAAAAIAKIPAKSKFDEPEEPRTPE
jgi:hypothetical protein